MTGSPAASTASPDSVRRAVEAVWRIESARTVATLTRVTGDFALAEDVAQEALAEALGSWPASGVPAKPGAWLVAVGRRRAIDQWRRQARQDDRYAQLARDLEDGEAPEWDPEAIEDDVLRLIFVACHPVLSREASIALTLRVVGGLTTEEIARAFLAPVATVQQRIVRAKKTLAAAAVPFEVPTPDEHPARLSAVLSVLYLGAGRTRCRRRSPSATTSRRRSSRPTGSGSPCCTRRWGVSPRRRSSSSTARWPCRCPRARRPRCASSTG